MTAWGNRYSALFQEPPTVKSSPTLSNNHPDSFSANQALDHTPIQSMIPSRPRYSPNSSVFVASLPNSIPPHEMQQRLSELISRFVNPLNVKIINDKMGNKAAFVQTKSIDDANLLINSQIYLDGKNLRLELARAHRTLVLSFKDTEFPPPKLRIIRNFEGFLRVVVDEKIPIEGWTPVRQDDRFSGSGYLLPHFEHSEISLHKLCELLGPLEEFKQIDLDTVKAKDPSIWLPHVLLSQDSTDQSGIWEVKWQTREDAMQAKSIVALLPFVNWTWAHTMAQTDYHNRNDYRNIRPHSGVPPFNKVRFAGDHPPFQPGLNIKGHRTALGLNGKDIRVPTRRSLKLDTEDFPPLTAGQHLPTPGNSRGKHERTVSEDTETPITPESLHHTSPEIANMSGDNRGVDLNLPETTIDKSVAPIQAVQTQPAIAEFDEVGFNYDRATLYIAGIPKSTKESQLRELFMGYGQIKNVAVFPNPRSDYNSAFIAFHDVESAANAMQSANGAHPAIVGSTKLRVRYKRVQVGGRYARRGRFPAQSTDQNGADRQPKQKPQLEVDESTQAYNSDGVNDLRDGKQGGEKSTSSVDEQARASSGDAQIKDDSAKSCDAAGASGASIHTEETDQSPNESSSRQSGEAPTSQVGEGASTSSVEATPPVVNPSPPKPLYYGYYASQFPANYHQPWGYSYPMYAPVYPYQSYGHPYWYPPGVMPVPPVAYASPRTPGDKVETGRMHTSASPTYGPVDHPFVAPTKPPVAPAASYQNPDGGITYVYPTEVIEKYVTKTRENNTNDSRNGTERSQQYTPQFSTPLYPSPMQYSHGTPHSPATIPSPLCRFRHPQETPDSTVGYDVHPSIAAAVYRNYAPPLPPPADKMPQGSFVFNPQGVVQHVEPAAYPQGGQMNGQSEVGVGLVQAAAAVVANGYHQAPSYPSPVGLSTHGQDGNSDVQSGSSRYPSPIPMPGPYYYPQNMYYPAPAQMGPGTHAYHEHPTGGSSGGRGGHRRRSGHVMPRAMYAIDSAGGSHAPGGQTM